MSLQLKNDDWGPMGAPGLREILELVRFKRDSDHNLFVQDVWGSVRGTIHGDANVILGDINGPVFGMVHGTINQREWQFVETTTERAVRLIREGKYEEAIELIEENQ